MSDKDTEAQILLAEHINDLWNKGEEITSEAFAREKKLFGQHFDDLVSEGHTPNPEDAEKIGGKLGVEHLEEQARKYAGIAENAMKKAEGLPLSRILTGGVGVGLIGRGVYVGSQAGKADEPKRAGKWVEAVAETGAGAALTAGSILWKR